MPDVADLRARLTANVADLKKGFSEASAASDDLGNSFQKLKADVAPVNQAVASVGDSAGALSATARDIGRDLALVASGGELTSQGVGRLALHLTEAAHAEALFAASNPAENATRLATAFADVAAANPSRTIGEVANVSAFLAATNPAAPMAALAEASARLAAVNPSVTIGEIATQTAEMVTAATVAPTAIEAIGAALVTIAPAVAAAGVAFVIFEKILTSANATLALSKKAVADWEKDLSAGVNKARDSLLKLEFKADVAGLDPINTAISEATENAQLEGRALALTSGEFENYVRKATEAATVTAGFGAAAKESQAAAEKFTAGMAAVNEGFAKLEGGLQFKSAEESFARLQGLAAEINFKGPLSDLQKLATALDQNEAKIRAIATANKDYQASEGQIRSEVEKTNALIKQRFSADQTLKFKLDQASLDKAFAQVPDTKTVVLQFQALPGRGGESQQAADQFVQQNRAEADRILAIWADVARMRAKGQEVFTTGPDTTLSAQTITPKLDTKDASAELQKLLDKFNAANPTLTISGSGSPTLPITEFLGTYVPGLLDKLSGTSTTLQFTADVTKSLEDARTKLADASLTLPLTAGQLDVTEAVSKAKGELAKSPLDVTLQATPPDLTKSLEDAKAKLDASPLALPVKAGEIDVTGAVTKAKTDLKKSPLDVALQVTALDLTKTIADAKAKLDASQLTLPVTAGQPDVTDAVSKAKANLEKSPLEVALQVMPPDITKTVDDAKAKLDAAPVTLPITVGQPDVAGAIKTAKVDLANNPLEATLQIAPPDISGALSEARSSLAADHLSAVIDVTPPDVSVALDSAKAFLAANPLTSEVIATPPDVSGALASAQAFLNAHPLTATVNVTTNISSGAVADTSSNASEAFASNPIEAPVTLSPDVAAGLANANAIIAANPLTATMDITPQIVMSPGVPFKDGIANMQSMLDSMARDVPKLNFGTNLQDIISESAAWSKQLGDFLKPTGAFDLLAKGIEADTAALVKAISEAREEARFFTSRADISGGVHLASVLTPSGFLPGDAERAQAFNNLAAQLEKLLAAIQVSSHESNDIARANLEATKGIARGLASSFFATDMLKQQQTAQRVAGGSSL